MPVGVGEDPAVVVDADGGKLGGLQRLPAAQHGDGGGVEIGAASGVVSLASGLVELVADGDDATVDGEPCFVEVDVGPLKAEELVAAHSGVSGQPERRKEALSGGGPQERL